MNRLVSWIVAAPLACSAAHSQDGLHQATAGVIDADRMADVPGSPLQTTDMLKKYILPALPCGIGKHEG